MLRNSRLAPILDNLLKKLHINIKMFFNLRIIHKFIKICLKYVYLNYEILFTEKFDRKSYMATLEKTFFGKGE